MFFKWLNRFTVKRRYLIVIFWTLAVASVMLFAPKLSDVVQSDQTSFLSKDDDSTKATDMMNKLFPERGGSSTFVLTLNRPEGISEIDYEYGRKLEEYLKSKSEYKIKSITSPFTKKELEGLMISKDKQAAIIQIELSLPSYKEVTNIVVRSVREDISNKSGKAKGAPAIPSGLIINTAGEAAMYQEGTDAQKESLDITTKITIILVAVILLIIYRSPFAMILPLVSIGISFLISRGIIASLTYMGLRISDFTETFLLAVLFGAGTDYCLLIMSRFREEMKHGKSKVDAIHIALPTAGEAILSSGSTVIIGFLCMLVAKFQLFSTTGPSIAIGIAITLMILMTLVPAILYIVGDAIFWPFRPSKVKKAKLNSNGFWSKLAHVITRRPVYSIILIMIIFIPILITIKDVNRSFDNVNIELPADSDVRKGFKVVEKHFNQGEIMPIEIVMESDKDMWSDEALQTIENIASHLNKVENVSKVWTATRPTGDKITEVSFDHQISILTSGINDIKGGFPPVLLGMGDIQSGVSTIASEMGKGGEDMGKLVSGTAKVKDGLSQIDSGLNQLSIKTKEAATGSSQVKTGVLGLKNGVKELKDKVDLLNQNVKQQGKALEPLAASNPTMEGLTKSFMELTAGLDGISAGLTQLEDGAGQASVGAGQLSNGLNLISGKMLVVKGSMNEIEKGLGDIENGQVKAQKGINDAATALNQVASGAQEGKEGLSKMQTGVSEVYSATNEYSAKGEIFDGVFLLPSGALEKYPELKDGMKRYISTNNKGILLQVILKSSPYEMKALDTVPKIKDAFKTAIQGTIFENAEFHVGGVPGSYSEIRDVTAKDFTLVMICVLAGIFIVLALMLRSLIAPIYLILTTVLSFGVTMGITYLVFQVGFGNEGVSWMTPFFTFSILVALGVDYNIFLMSRVKEEYRTKSVKEAVNIAVGSTGGIITSCGIIMAGTFGALMASPVGSMIEIGFATVVGLILDTFIIRCILVPAIAVTMGEVNWWPGKKLRVINVDKENAIQNESAIDNENMGNRFNLDV